MVTFATYLSRLIFARINGPSVTPNYDDDDVIVIHPSGFREIHKNLGFTRA